MRISDWSSDVCSSDLKKDPHGEDFLPFLPVRVVSHSLCDCRVCVKFRSATGGLPWSALHDRFHIVQIGAADAVNAAVAQIDAPRAVAMMTQPGDAVAAYHFRAMDADEAIGVQPRLQRLDRLMDQPAARADMQAHIVALGLDQVDLRGVDAQHLAPVLDPEFGDPPALALVAAIGRTPFTNAGQGAGEPFGDRKSTRLNSSH